MKIVYFLITLPILKRLLPSIIRNFLVIINKKIFFINFKDIILETNILDPHDRKIFLTNKYEEKQFSFLISNIKKNKSKIFIDVGANSGLYSLLIAKEIKDVNIIAFEPIKDTYDKFLRNIKTNKLEEQIKPYNLGLSNISRQTKMRTIRKLGYNQSAGYTPSDEGQDSAYLVKGDKVLNFKKFNLAIKIDVEGHEIYTLEGLQKIINNNAIFLQIEIFDNKIKEISSFLKKNNFTFLKKINNDYFYVNY